jgi:hypothetical protein
MESPSDQPGHEAGDQSRDESDGGSASPIDLDGIERDLAGVEVALARLDAGTYWTDEVTGQPLAAELLAVHPTARRAEG